MNVVTRLSKIEIQIHLAPSHSNQRSIQLCTAKELFLDQTATEAATHLLPSIPANASVCLVRGGSDVFFGGCSIGELWLCVGIIDMLLLNMELLRMMPSTDMISSRPSHTTGSTLDTPLSRYLQIANKETKAAARRVRDSLYPVSPVSSHHKGFTSIFTSQGHAH